IADELGGRLADRPKHDVGIVDLAQRSDGGVEQVRHAARDEGLNRTRWIVLSYGVDLLIWPKRFEGKARGEDAAVYSDIERFDRNRNQIDHPEVRLGAGYHGHSIAGHGAAVEHHRQKNEKQRDQQAQTERRYEFYQ